MPVMVGSRGLIVALTLALIAGACAGPSSQPASVALASPTPVATAVPASLPATATPSPTLPRESAMPFTLTSASFASGGAIPRKFTCDGADMSPALSWAGVPGGSVTLALIVDDPDARGFVHWVAFDIPVSSPGLAEGASSAAGAPPQGRNDFGKVGWGGPCPPSGTHHYRFTLLALDTKLGLTGGPKGSQVRQAAEGHILDQAVLTATYRRG